MCTPYDTTIGLFYYYSIIDYKFRPQNAVIRSIFVLFVFLFTHHTFFTCSTVPGNYINVRAFAHVMCLWFSHVAQNEQGLFPSSFFFNEDAECFLCIRDRFYVYLCTRNACCRLLGRKSCSVIVTRLVSRVC